MHCMQWCKGASKRSARRWVKKKINQIVTSGTASATSHVTPDCHSLRGQWTLASHISSPCGQGFVSMTRTPLQHNYNVCLFFRHLTSWKADNNNFSPAFYKIYCCSSWTLILWYISLRPRLRPRLRKGKWMANRMTTALSTDQCVLCMQLKNWGRNHVTDCADSKRISHIYL